MNRMTVALLAALDALIVAAIGIGVALVPLTVLWAAQFHLAVDWGAFWRAAADIWLLGHGVNLTITLPATLAAGLGVAQATAPFQVTIAVLGFAVLAVLMGVRTGTRAAETPFRATGAISAIAAYGAIGAIVTLAAGRAIVQPSLWQGIVLPTFVFGIGVLIGEGVGAARADDTAASWPGLLRSWRQRLSQTTRDTIAAALRAGTAASAIVIAAAGVIVAILLIAKFGTVVGLYEQLQAGALGATVLTIAQLALLPNAVVWAASWLLGPGFAIGTGSSVSAVGTQLGPVPGVPLFGIVPQGTVVLGFAGLLVPVLAGFFAGALTRRRMARMPGGAPSAGRLTLIALAAGCVAGVELGLLAWWSSGAIGPGRLHDAGPNPWMVAGCAAVVIAIAAIVGILTGASRHDRGRTAVNETGFDPAASDSNTTLSNATPDSIGIYQRMTRGGRENDPS
jgi:hypothetical protein